MQFILGVHRMQSRIGADRRLLHQDTDYQTDRYLQHADK